MISEAIELLVNIACTASKQSASRPKCDAQVATQYLSYQTTVVQSERV